MRAGLALIVLVLNIIAIVSVLGARRTASSKLAWTAAVVLLPLAGALGWFALGRARSRGP
ncbi:MAG TPA: PLD nuclease N-terminal domain-containing protein [Longimicrobiales bacterium]